jgi:hypothetical protein
MTAVEHATILAAARRAGLSVARYLVEAGVSSTRIAPDPTRFDLVEQRLRGPRGYLRVAFLHLFKLAPCELWRTRAAPRQEAHSQLHDADRRKFEPGAAWARHATVGDVVVWDCRTDGDEFMFRVGVVEVRRIRVVGWFDRQEGDHIVDTILLSRL